MNQSKSIKIIVGALILALLVFIGFKYLNTSEEVSNPDDVLGVTGQTEVVVGKDIIIKLTLLNLIHLDDSIFKSDMYNSLRDFTLEVVSEPKGRSNPFAPIGLNSTFRATSTGSLR